MAQITVFATIVAKKEKVEFVKEELLKLVELTRKENGCIDYILHQDNEIKSHFLMYEIWENEEFLEEHVKNKALTQYLAVTENAISSFIVNKMINIS